MADNILHNSGSRVRRRIIPALVISAAFLSGFAFRSALDAAGDSGKKDLKKVTGIGGIFFKCKDPKALREWYAKHLGLNTNEYGAVFEWYQGADSTQKGFTSWSPFKESTKYFAPSKRDFMINYRVANLPALLAELSNAGVTVLDTIQRVDYGKFAHILDGEGNKVELWEPNDIEYEKLGAQLGAKTTK